MGDILNAEGKLHLFERSYRNKYFVDKSKILTILNQLVGTDQQYVCITRPRRFGKTVMTNLISSYYAKGLDSKSIFDTLKIAKDSSYEEHLNKHHVISLNMSEMPEMCDSYERYIIFHMKRIKNDLIECFSEVSLSEEMALWEMFSKIQRKVKEGFIFIIDEWDSYFHSKFFTEDGGVQYLSFLRTLLKDQPYVDLAYITGIMTIRKYSSGSEMNMFREYHFPTDSIYDTYFGFTEEEVMELCQRNKRNGGTIQYEQLVEWYNGYYTHDGKRLYNPRSVNNALNDNKIQNYWTETGPGTEILGLVQKNVDEVKEDLLKMVSGQKVYLSLDMFSTDLYEFDTREKILSAMVVYGFLSYYDGELSIPNKEIMIKFQNTLQDKSLGYIAELARNSDIMLQATLKGDTEKMAEILTYVHDTEIPILQYNDENSLSCIVNLIYLKARDRYRIEREEKTGKGFVDFIFYPLRAGEPAIILELKIDDTPEHAIEQIVEKKYDTKLRELKNGKVVCTGPILLVGMVYDRGKKEHCCLVQELEREI